METTHRKSIEGLLYCLENDDHEDALGHIGDLFIAELVRLNRSMLDRNLQVFSAEQAFNHYVANASREYWPSEIPRKSQHER